MGRKRAGEKNGFIASYEIAYQPGELKAICYREGMEAESKVLFTAGDVTELSIEVEGELLQADGADLTFITIGLADCKGNENLFEKKEVSIKVEGAGHLQGFGSANPRCGKSFQDTTWETYDGYVMAVIRAGNSPGNIRIKVSAPGCETKELIIPVS